MIAAGESSGVVGVRIPASALNERKGVVVEPIADEWLLLLAAIAWGLWGWRRWRHHVYNAGLKGLVWLGFKEENK